MPAVARPAQAASGQAEATGETGKECRIHPDGKETPEMSGRDGAARGIERRRW